MIRRAASLLLALLAASPILAAGVGTVQGLKAQLDVTLRLLDQRLTEIEQHQSDLDQAWARVENLSSDLLRAHRQLESLESLKLRDSDLRLAEAELMMHVTEAERLRSEAEELRSEAEMLRQRIEELGHGSDREGDVLSGKWKLTVEPGGLEGTVTFTLDGTLVTGVYELSGGWYGSLRGTLVAGKVRLERIDSQLGLAAIFYGRFFGDESPPRLQGHWEGTNLSAGLPSSGSWVATKVEEKAQEAP